jgi:hypothetical protein
MASGGRMRGDELHLVTSGRDISDIYLKGLRKTVENTVGSSVLQTSISECLKKNKLTYTAALQE